MNAFVENSVDVSVDVPADVRGTSESLDRWIREELQRVLAIWDKLGAREFAEAELHCEEDVPVWQHEIQVVDRAEVRLARAYVYRLARV